MGSISTLSGRSNPRPYYRAHYRRHGTWNFSTKICDICMAGRGCQNALFLMYVPFLGVQFLGENFSLYMVMVGLTNFSRYNVCVWKSYDQPSLNLNNSTSLLFPDSTKKFRTDGWHNPMCSMSSLGRLVAYGTPLQLDRHSSLCCGWNTMTHCHHETIIIFKKKNDFNIAISYLFLFWTVRLFKHSESIGERRLSMSLPVAQNRCSEAVDDAGIARKWRATAEQYASTCSLHRVHRANSQTLPSALPG